MKINIINKILLGLTFLIIGVGCSESFLDRENDDKKTAEEVYTRYEEVNKLVSHAYARARSANRPLVWLNHFGSAPITDECEGSNVEGNIPNLYNTGAWNAEANLPGNEKQFWSDLYKSIRHINMTLEGIEKYNTPDNPRNSGDLNRRIGELYFFRGYLHWVLLRNYGEIVYVDYDIPADEIRDFNKESAHEIVEKIVKDAEEAYSRVQDVYTRNDENFGRVDQGACLGLIAIARWTVATPLYNGAKENGYTGTRIHEADYTYDRTRWVKARDAAKAVLDFTVKGKKRYSLYTKYTNTDFDDDGGRNLNGSLVYTRLWDMFHDYDALTSEAVFFMARDKDQAWQGDMYPPSRGGGSRQRPVQEQVDEYEYMAEDGYGYPVYSVEARKFGYDDENPYLKRDPRFYRDILYHGAPYRDNNNNGKPLNTAEGSDMIGNGNSATNTGYYSRKFMKDGYNKSGNFQMNCPPIWRLPEFIYIYAEAVNELEGPTQEIYDLINQVRARSFMHPMPPSVLTSKEAMFDYIQRERRVEFYYENKRVWNCRLYLEPSNPTELAKEKEFESLGANNDERSINYWLQHKGPYPKCQRMINGMRPVEDPNGKIEVNGVKYRMERFCVEERVFDAPKHYLFPIPSTEIQKAGTLVQNPEW